MPGLTQPASRHAFEAVDEVGERHLRRVVDEKVHVVWLARGFDQPTFKVEADLLEHLAGC